MKLEEYLTCPGNFGFLCCSSEDGDVAALVPLHTMLAYLHEIPPGRSEWLQ